MNRSKRLSHSEIALALSSTKNPKTASSCPLTPIKQTRSIGLLLSHMQNSFTSLLVSSLTKELSALGYNLVVRDLKNDPQLLESRLTDLLQYPVEGLFLSEIELSKEQQQSLEALDLPIVSISTPISLAKADSILLNNRTTTEKVLARMIESGHRRIGVIASPQNTFITKEQLQGVTDAVYANQAFVEHIEFYYGDYSTASGYKGMQRLLDQEVTAVFSCNYKMAIGGLQALYQQELPIDRQLSFASFDYTGGLDSLYPNVTTIHQPIETIGKLAAHRISKKIQSQNQLTGATYIQYNTIHWQDKLIPTTKKVTLI
ncbi:LacI family DNA-binding transcriptional regulator [Enterococcus olivae]